MYQPKSPIELWLTGLSLWKTTVDMQLNMGSSLLRMTRFLPTFAAELHGETGRPVRKPAPPKLEVVRSAPAPKPVAPMAEAATPSAPVTRSAAPKPAAVQAAGIAEKPAAPVAKAPAPKPEAPKRRRTAPRKKTVSLAPTPGVMRD